MLCRTRLIPSLDNTLLWIRDASAHGMQPLIGDADLTLHVRMKSKEEKAAARESYSSIRLSITAFRGVALSRHLPELEADIHQ